MRARPVLLLLLLPVLLVGPAAGPATAQATTGDGRFVTQLYADLLDRAPDPDGHAHWTGRLAAGVDRGSVSNGFTYSREARTRLVGFTYATYLDRAADPEGGASWVDAMTRGLSTERFRSQVLGSPEHYGRAGGTPETWAAELYRDVLGRSATSSEVQETAAAVRRGTPRDQVALTLLLGTEHLRILVQGFAQDLLGRAATRAEEDDWVQRIATGSPDEDVIAVVVASDEYAARAG